MRRDHYTVFSPVKIGPLTLSNRLVRSATWDPSILKQRCLTPEVESVYRRVAEGGVGMIITGDFSVLPEGIFDAGRNQRPFSYDDVCIAGYSRLPDVVHRAAPQCKLVAQLSAEYPGAGPSDVPSPFNTERTRPLSTEEVSRIGLCLVEVIDHIRDEGFDGVQLHAAHGGIWWGNRCDAGQPVARFDRAPSHWLEPG